MTKGFYDYNYISQLLTYHMKKIILLSFFFIGFLYHSNAQETINTMFYNILDFPEAPPSDRASILKKIITDYQPDLFMVCELQSQDGANIILNTSLQTANQKYKMAQFVSNQSNPNTHLQQLIFYNKDKLILDRQRIITTAVRDINHYTFILNTADATINPIYLDVFVTHLKSSQGYANEQERLQMVTEFTDKLSSIPTDHFLIFAGDLNLYTANEDAYQELLDPSNAIIFKDPINTPGGWHNNDNYQHIHTQSTRVSSYGRFDGHGAGGGLDDRFDFILISENLQNSNTLHYVENSYKAYGNNGNCFNKNINNMNCTGEFSQEMRNNLYNMSDHLPVVLQLETNFVLSSTENTFLKKTIQLTHGNLIYNRMQLEINPEALGSQLEIYNNLGQIIKRTFLTQTHTTINVTQLAKGIYYLHLKNDYPHNTLKFIKL